VAPDCQIDTKTLDHIVRQRHDVREIFFLPKILVLGADAQLGSNRLLLANLVIVDSPVDSHITAHRDLEQLSALVELFEHPFITGGREVRHADLHRRRIARATVQPLTLDFAANPVNTAGALLDGRRVPRQVMMDDVAALSVQINIVVES